MTRPPVTEKRCPMCGVVKAIEEFGPKPRSRCAPCRVAAAAIRNSERRRTDPEYRERMREYNRHHRNIEAERERDRARREEQKVKGSKPWARGKLRKAVQTGRVLKPAACEQCGVEPPPAQLHGHHWHNDYANRPLDVQWLCAMCHGAEHAIHAVPPRDATGEPAEPERVAS